MGKSIFDKFDSKKLGNSYSFSLKINKKKHGQSRSSHVYKCHVSSALLKPCILLSTLTVVPKGHYVKKNSRHETFTSQFFSNQSTTFLYFFSNAAFFLHPILRIWFCQILSRVRHRNKNFSTFTTKRDMNSHKIWWHSSKLGLPHPSEILDIFGWNLNFGYLKSSFFCKKWDFIEVNNWWYLVLISKTTFEKFRI